MIPGDGVKGPKNTLTLNRTFDKLYKVIKILRKAR